MMKLIATGLKPICRRLIFAALLLSGLPAFGGTYTVTSTADTGAAGTLRWAINQANADSGSTIQLTDNLGTITFTSQTPLITAAMTIKGGIGNTVSGNSAHRIFFVDLPSSTGSVVIENITLANGLAKGGDGGDGGGGGGLGAGGAIFVNSGAVTLKGVGFSNNAATGGTGGSGTPQNLGGYAGGGGGGLGGNGGAGNGSHGGGGGGGYGGNGGAAHSGTGGGGGLIGNGGNGSTEPFEDAGGGGGGLTNGQNAAPWNQGGAGAGGSGGGHGGDLATQAQNGATNGGGGGGFANAGYYNIFTPSGEVSNGGDGGKFGGGGGGSAAYSPAFPVWAGSGGDFGGGGGLNGKTFALQTAGNGGWGGGGGGGSMTNDAGDRTKPGLGGFGGGGGGSPDAASSTRPNGLGGMFGGDGGSANGFLGGGGGGGALGANIFVRSGTGGSLTILDGDVADGLLTAGAGGFTRHVVYSEQAESGRTAGSAMFLDGGTTTISVTSGQKTIYGSIGDASVAGGQAGSLLITGDGSLTLVADNTYGGTTTVFNSMLQIGNGGTTGSLASSAMVLENYSNVTFYRSTDSTYAGDISGQGYLVKFGAGTLTLTGNNTFGGGIIMSEGTIALESAEAIGTGTHLINGGTLRFSAANTTDYSSRIGSMNGQVLGIDTNGQNVTFASRLASPNGTLNKLGAGTLTLSGADDNSSLTAVVNGGSLLLAKTSSATVHAVGTGPSGSILTINSGGTARLGGTGGDQIPNSATVQINAGGTLDLNGRSEVFSKLAGSGIIHNSAASTLGTLTLGQDNSSSSFSGGLRDGGGSLALVKTGTGTLTLSGESTFSGDTTVSQGTLRLSGAFYNFGAAAGILTVQSGATLDLQGQDIFGNALVNPNVRLTIESGGLVTNGNFYNTFTNLALNGGELRAGGGGSSTWTAYQLKGTVTAGGSSASSITTTGASNSQIHLGNNTAGGFTTFQVADATASSASDLVISAVLQNGRASNNSFVDTSLVKTGVGTLTLVGDNAYTGGTTVSNGILQIGNGGTSGSVMGNITNNAALVFNRSDASTHAGVISGNGTLAKLGAGALTLTANNTYTGATTVDVGTLRIEGTTASSGFAIASSAVLELIPVSDYAASVTFSGSGTLRKSGTASARWAEAAATFALGSGSLIDVQTGTFVGGSNANDVWTNNKSDLNVADGAIFNGVEANVRVDALTGSGTIRSGFNGAGYQGFTFGVDNGSGTFSGVLADNPGAGVGAHYIKAGSGTQTLAESNTHTGGTTIQAGTLALGHAGALGSTGTISFTGGTLQFSAANTTDYSSRFANTSGQVYGIDTNGQNVTLASRVASLNGSLTKTGAGSLTFSGAADNTALAVVVNAGTVVLAKDSTADVHAIGGGAPAANLIVYNGGTAQLGGTGGDQIYFGATVQVNTGGSLDLNGRSEGFARLDGSGTVRNSAASTSGTLTLGEDNVSSTLNAQLLNGSGTLALAKAGSGTVILNGNNSYTGGTRLLAGSLVVANNNAVGGGAVEIVGGTLLVNAGVSLSNAVQLSGGNYHRAFSAESSLVNAVNATSSFAGNLHDTSARILQGTLSSSRTLETGFAENSAALNDAIRQSAVYSLHGTGSDLFVLELSFAEIVSGSFLGWLDTDLSSETYNQWVSAVEGNTGNNALISMQNFSGSFAAFQALHGTLTLQDYIGAYGHDEDEGSVWAVLNHNSDFTVVPEPSTWTLLILGSLSLLGLYRKTRLG